jgi:hypothetical protein
MIRVCSCFTVQPLDSVMIANSYFGALRPEFSSLCSRQSQSKHFPLQIVWVGLVAVAFGTTDLGTHHICRIVPELAPNLSGELYNNLLATVGFELSFIESFLILEEWFIKLTQMPAESVLVKCLNPLLIKVAVRDQACQVRVFWFWAQDALISDIDRGCRLVQALSLGGQGEFKSPNGFPISRPLHNLLQVSQRMYGT